MNLEQIIKIEKSKGGKNIVSARQVWQAMESKQHFADWIKKKLLANFEYNKDYSIIEYDLYNNLIASDNSMKSDNERVRVHKRDYPITLDTAKHLALMENTARGKAVHRFLTGKEEELNGTRLTKKSNSSQVRAYFEAIVKLNSSSKKFPVNLNDVWMLEYSTKGNAIKSLKANFVYGFDYESFIQVDKRKIGATSAEDYHLTASCLEYFIARKNRDVFNIYREVFHKAISRLPQTFSEALRALADKADENEKQAQQLRLKNTKIELDAPKVAFADAVQESEGLILVRDLAKLLKQKGVDTGEKKLYKWMRENKFLTQKNTPTQRSVTLQVLELVESVYNDDEISFTTKVTGKGQVYFMNKFLRIKNIKIK